jgi:hypothetical protein
MSFTPQRPIRSLFLKSKSKDENGKHQFLNIASEWPTKDGNGTHWRLEAKSLRGIGFVNGPTFKSKEDFDGMLDNWYVNFRDSEAGDRNFPKAPKHTERLVPGYKYDDDPLNESRGGADSYDDLPF